LCRGVILIKIIGLEKNWNFIRNLISILFREVIFVKIIGLEKNFLNYAIIFY